MSANPYNSLAIAAAHSATEASAVLLRMAREENGPFGAYDYEEPIPKLLDAAKMAIEASGEDLGGELGQVYAAVSKFLEGWAQ